MDSLINKYNKGITQLILISFLFVTIVSIFHFHHFDFLGNQLVNRLNTTEKSDQFLNDDLQVVCTVQFNYTKLHLINFSDLSHKNFTRDFQGLNYTQSEYYLLLSAGNHSYNLRAPPSF
jgi:hypothetical protein